MASMLQDLIALAQEPSSQRRRELLREVTDLFFVAPAAHNAQEMELFDGVLTTLASEMEEEVRAELATRLAPSPYAPAGIVRVTSLRACIHSPKRCHCERRMQPIPSGPASSASVAGVARARKRAEEAVTLARIASDLPGCARACAVPARRAVTKRPTMLA